MRLYPSLSAVFLLVAIFFLIAGEEKLEAQRPWHSRTRINRYHRFTGNWFSDGYHVATPGPQVNYYQPWSAHNTSQHSPWQKGEGYHSSGMGLSYPLYDSKSFPYPTPHSQTQIPEDSVQVPRFPTPAQGNGGPIKPAPESLRAPGSEANPQNQKGNQLELPEMTRLYQPFPANGIRRRISSSLRPGFGFPKQNRK